LFQNSHKQTMHADSYVNVQLVGTCSYFSLFLCSCFSISAFHPQALLAIVGLRMRSVTWNRFPILKIFLTDSNPPPLRRLVTRTSTFYDCARGPFPGDDAFFQAQRLLLLGRRFISKENISDHSPVNTSTYFHAVQLARILIRQSQVEIKRVKIQSSNKLHCCPNFTNTVILLYI